LHPLARRSLGDRLGDPPPYFLKIPHFKQADFLLPDGILQKVNMGIGQAR
jgi:hypothetical protein